MRMQDRGPTRHLFFACATAVFFNLCDQANWGGPGSRDPRIESCCSAGGSPSCVAPPARGQHCCIEHGQWPGGGSAQHRARHGVARLTDGMGGGGQGRTPTRPPAPKKKQHPCLLPSHLGGEGPQATHGGPRVPVQPPPLGYRGC